MHVFSAVFVFVFIVIILYKIVEFLRNEAAAEISVPARLVDKSMRASNDMNANGFARQSITYYLRYELDNVKGWNLLSDTENIPYMSLWILDF
ncbi:DUF2500 family protein [Enterococcus sp.]|uniref:DUF2500 family protein n=1 Tax=Enterococcus sp. TaxID=35783 RepID=UPI00289A5FCC|nr:DUF2500 family protein [Enterococcus sp.]